jgi:dihydroorotate dehydrogenase (NAD+) catalytic subunit
VGSVELPNPVLTASGTSGHGAELNAFFPLSRLGAVVVKSLAPMAWAGNPAPRVHAAGPGMLNSVGLQGPGIEVWLRDELPGLEAAGARVVASIWGTTVEQYASAAAHLSRGHDSVVALEVNLSCPNLDGGRHLFAQSMSATADVVDASLAAGLPVWAKLTPTVTDIVDIAGSALSAGAEAVTLVNTALGMAIDPETRRYRLGAGPGGGGLSGPALRPIAVRAIHDVHRAFPAASIVGVGGVTTAADAVEMLLAGACAVQVGTATFADPRAPVRVLEGLEDWCRRHGVRRLDELIGGVHE